MLPRIECPTLLVRAQYGEDMPGDVWAKTQSLLKHAIVREMPNANHNVHLSDPDTFYGFVDELLDSEG